MNRIIRLDLERHRSSSLSVAPVATVVDDSDLLDAYSRAVTKVVRERQSIGREHRSDADKPTQPTAKSAIARQWIGVW